MNISLPYGVRWLNFKVPEKNLLAIVEPAEVPSATDPAAEVREALRHPVDAPPLAELVKRDQQVLIIIDDNTRPTPTHEILPPLLDELHVQSRGLDVKILIASGTHRPMTKDEIDAKVGPQVAGTYPVINHDWGNENALVDLGRTPNGTPIRVNRLVMESDLVIGIGNTVPHCLAGWAGGAKIIQPGVCGKDTTNMTHALNMISPTPHLGRLDNPMRREIEEVVSRAKLDFMVNTVLNRHGAIVHVIAGAPTISHRRSVELACPIWVRPVPGLADIVIVNSYPSDIDYWQAIKGLFAAELIVKRGGDIILATPCPERIAGNREHVESMRAMKGLPSKQMLYEAKRLGITDLAGINTAVVAARINELAWVSVVSDGLTDEDLGILGHERANNIQEALIKALARQGRDAKIIVISHGGEICPIISST